MTKELASAIQQALPRVAIDLQNALRLAAPVDTGALKNSIEIEVTSFGLRITMVDYAKFVEFGSLPHIILPNQKQALRWKPRGSQEEIFAKSVRHPGVRPNPFIRTTIRKKLGGIIEKRLREAL